MNQARTWTWRRRTTTRLKASRARVEDLDDRTTGAAGPSPVTTTCGAAATPSQDKAESQREVAEKEADAEKARSEAEKARHEARAHEQRESSEQ